MNTLEDLWKKVLNNIKGSVNTPTFKTWFEPIKPVSLKKNTLTVSVNSSFAKEWLESRHLNTITSSAQKAANSSIKIKINVEPGVFDDTGPNIDEEPAAVRSLLKVKKEPVFFNPKYSFDTFVEGTSNRFAYTASQVVSEKPGKAYNPLFIYGGVGLGKTHLLHAIGQYVSKLFPNLVVKYVSAEKFLNDFINALRYKNIISFKDSYRNNDVLLVDDIQFLEEKEASQEEFFHTFNALHGTNKQIVLSSDRSPKDLSTLEDRLRSRFEWGLVTDIQPPNLETRIAILKKYSEREKLEISDQILNLIAEKITSNIREMEGAVIRIVAFSSFTKTDPDASMARSILKDMLPDDKDRKTSNQKIIKEVSKYFAIPINTLIGGKRSQYVAHARQIGMYICRDLTSDSLPTIGRAFGNRDHATVIYAISKINELISRDRDVYKQIQEITNRVKSSS
ncbi:MAG: chromosomal replication initiator protein DnaA [Actinobacteria bacterium]|nr:chromosomal replication initiator protein DnaA [Actinomycetota bacterium]MBM3712492.1 chromosomal replication initiator protein DnaA [Actinomycetota bacterium]